MIHYLVCRAFHVNKDTCSTQNQMNATLKYYCYQFSTFGSRANSLQTLFLGLLLPSTKKMVDLIDVQATKYDDISYGHKWSRSQVRAERMSQPVIQEAICFHYFDGGYFPSNPRRVLLKKSGLPSALLSLVI